MHFKANLFFFHYVPHLPTQPLTLNQDYWGGDTKKGEAGLIHPIPQGFSSLLLKPYIKELTHSQEVGWWRTLMVESLTLF